MHKLGMWQPVTVPGLLLYSFIYRRGTLKVKPSMSVPFKARFLKKCLCNWFCSFSEWRLHSLFLHCWGNIQTHWFYRDCLTSGFIGMDKDTQGNVLTSLNVISVAAWNDGVRCKILSHFCNRKLPCKFWFEEWEMAPNGCFPTSNQSNLRS